MTVDKVDDRLLMQLRDAVCSNDQPADLLTECLFKRAAQVILAAYVEKFCLKSQRARRRFGLVPFGWDSRIAHVVKQGNARETRNQLFQDLDPFCRQLGAESDHPCDVAFGAREASHD